MISVFCNPILQIILVSPFVCIAWKERKNKTAYFLFLAILLFFITSVTNDLFGTFAFFKGQRWNWLGKIACTGIALVFIYRFKFISARQFGLTKKIETNGTKPILLICTGYLLIRIFLFFCYDSAGNSHDLETVLFQSTLPGIAEELIFRCILLTLLNSVFEKQQWRFARINFGWAALITSILFGFTHSLFFANHFYIQFNTLAWVRTAFDGFLFALLVQKTRSVVPAIVYHNLLNLISSH